MSEKLATAVRHVRGYDAELGWVMLGTIVGELRLENGRYVIYVGATRYNIRNEHKSIGQSHPDWEKAVKTLKNEVIDRDGCLDAMPDEIKKLHEIFDSDKRPGKYFSRKEGRERARRRLESNPFVIDGWLYKRLVKNRQTKVWLYAQEEAAEFPRRTVEEALRHILADERLTETVFQHWDINWRNDIY